MLTALLATTGATLFGCADFLGGLASRRGPALTVSLQSQAVGLVILTLVSLPMGLSAALRTDTLWGVLAGCAGALGVASLYAGLATGRMSVVAPVTAALSGSIPAAYDLATGSEVGPVALAGLALALVAIVIVSVSGHDQAAEGAGRALMLALVAGVCFGGSVLSYAQTTAESGFWPLAAARLTSVTFLLAATLVSRTRVRLPREAQSPALFTGALDASANMSLVLALRLGPVAVASVLGALYPVATVLLARFVLHEHIRGWQRVGVALALVAVVLAAVR